MVDCNIKRSINSTLCLKRTENIDVHVNWVVENFSGKQVGNRIKSNIFSSGINEHSWSLKLDLNPNSIELYLISIFSSTIGPPLIVDISDVQLLNSDMQIVVREEGPKRLYFFPSSNFPAYVIRTDFEFIGRNMLLPSDELHIHCKIRYGIEGSSIVGTFSEVNNEFTSLLPKGTLAKRFQRLFSEEMDSFSDVKIEVNGTVFPCHKVVLATGSPVLSALLKSSGFTENETDILKIQDTNPHVFNEFLRFLYLDRVENLDEDLAMDLFVLADKYLVDYLKGQCEVFLSGSVIAENVCQLLAFAEQYSAVALKKISIDYINKNYREICVTQAYVQLKKSNPQIGFDLMDAFMDSMAPSSSN